MIPDKRDDVDRRTVLRASGATLAASIVGLAGCAEPDGDGEDGEPIDTPTPGDEATPTPGEETPTPTPGEETPTPTPGEETPTPGEETPTPGEETPTPEDD